MDPFPRGTRISQEFRASPGGYNPPGGHTGRDYAVLSGTPVRAAADGIIRNSDWLTDNYAANPWWLTRYGGDTLVLDTTDAFGRTETMPTFVYAHLSDSTAPVGARVKKGQIIGYSGNSGTATSGPHCHVERLNPGYDLTNDVYGRSPLDFDEYYGAAAQAGPITEEGTLSAEDVAAINQHTTEQADRVIDYIGRLLTSEYKMGSQMIPGGNRVGIVTQARVTATLALVTAMASNKNMTPEQVTEAVEKALAGGVDVNVTFNAKPEGPVV